MTLSELQSTAHNGDEFYAYSLRGERYLCRWKSVKRGIFVILECNGKSVKRNLECDVKGAPNVRVEAMPATASQ